MIGSDTALNESHRLLASMVHSDHSPTSSHASLSGFPEEDLRVGSKRNVGYFPAWLGQSFLGGKYIVVRKLGWGQYTSVWLARDRELVIGITTQAHRATNSIGAGISAHSMWHRAHRYVRWRGIFYVFSPGAHHFHSDLKHDNICFRPSDLDNVVLYNLKTDPSRTYTCLTQQRPPVVPIVSQPLSVSLEALNPDAIDIVIGDLGGCTFDATSFSVFEETDQYPTHSPLSQPAPL